MSVILKAILATALMISSYPAFSSYFLSEEGKQAFQELQETAKELFPTTRIGKVKVKLKAKSEADASLFNKFISDKYTLTLKNWMERAIDSYKSGTEDKDNPLVFTGCEDISEYARMQKYVYRAVPQVDECISQFYEKNLVQFEFYVEEVNHINHQSIAVTSDIFTSGPRFRFKRQIPEVTKVVVRSDSWDTILRSELAPGQKAFTVSEGQNMANLLGFGKWVEGLPLNLKSLSDKFYSNQRFRMQAHVAGSALELVGAYYFISGMVGQAAVKKALEKAGQAAVKSRGSKALGILGTKGGSLMSQIGAKGAKAAAPKLLLQKRIQRAVLTKNILIQLTNGLASTSLLIHALHLEQMLDYLDDHEQRETIEAAILVIHVAAFVVGSTEGTSNIISHLGQHSHRGHSGVRLLAKKIGLKDLKNAIKVVRESRAAKAFADTIKKPFTKVPRAAWSAFWGKVHSLGDATEALMDITHRYAHNSGALGGIPVWLACPFDDFLAALPSMLAGGSGMSHFHGDSHAKDMLELPAAQNTLAEDMDLLLSTQTIALEEFLGAYPRSQKVDYSQTLISDDKVKVKVWGLSDKKFVKDEYLCHSEEAEVHCQTL